MQSCRNLQSSERSGRPGERTHCAENQRGSARRRRSQAGGGRTGFPTQPQSLPHCECFRSGPDPIAHIAGRRCRRSSRAGRGCQSEDRGDRDRRRGSDDGRGQLQNAEAVVEQRQAALEQAELDRERTEIRAPIDGVIIKRDVNPGQTVAVTLEAKTLFKIAQDLRRWRFAEKLTRPMSGACRSVRTRFTVDAYPDRIIRGRVLQIQQVAGSRAECRHLYRDRVGAQPRPAAAAGMTAVLSNCHERNRRNLKSPEPGAALPPSSGTLRRSTCIDRELRPRVGR